MTIPFEQIYIYILTVQSLVLFTQGYQLDIENVFTVWEVKIMRMRMSRPVEHPLEAYSVAFDEVLYCM
jgi:hypothetical protein